MVTYANKNMTRLWCSIMFKIGVEQTQGNEGSYFYLYPFEDLIQRSFQRNFNVCIEERSFLSTFLTKTQLKVN